MSGATQQINTHLHTFQLSHSYTCLNDSSRRHHVESHDRRRNSSYQYMHLHLQRHESSFQVHTSTRTGRTDRRHCCNFTSRLKLHSGTTHDSVGLRPLHPDSLESHCKRLHTADRAWCHHIGSGWVGTGTRCSLYLWVWKTAGLRNCWNSQHTYLTHSCATSKCIPNTPWIEAVQKESQTLLLARHLVTHTMVH